MEQTKESKRIIGGKMYVINIKSRYEQTPQNMLNYLSNYMLKIPSYYYIVIDISV